MTPKPIETQYNGFRFRSRLEARYAVLFDYAGLRYDYEPQGFDFGGVYYLPDFWLTDRQLWVEVKGEEPTADERQRAWMLCMTTKAPVLILVGDIGSGIHAGSTSHYQYLFDGEAVKEYRHILGSLVFSLLGLDHGRVDDYIRAMRAARFEHLKVVKVNFDAAGRRRFLTDLANPTARLNS